MNILTQIEELNRKYKLNNANGFKNNNSINYIIINGDIPILLSAPHAVKQVRDGNISKYIAQHTNIPSIQLEISSKFRKDNNYLEQLIVCLKTIIENINKRCLSNKKELEK